MQKAEFELALPHGRPVREERAKLGFCWSSALPCWSKSASFIVSEEYHKGRKGLAEEPGVLVATHEERADHPLQDLLPFQASFQVPTCGYLWWWFAAHTNLRFALPAYHPFHHEQL